MSARSCGACTACCTVLGVRELAKPPYQRCENLGRQGCSVYADRPHTCSVYACEWLKGMGQRRHRPDRVGLIVDSFAPPVHVQERAAAGDEDAMREVATASRIVNVREVRRGALHERQGKALAHALHARGLTVTITPYSGRRLPTGVVL